MVRIAFFFAILAALPLPSPVYKNPSQKAPSAEDVPLFSARVRVVTASGGSPMGKRFPFHMRSTLLEASGEGWTPWWNFDPAEAKKLFRGSYPVLISLQIARLTEPISLELEIRVDETNETRKVALDLIGPVFTLMSWRD